MALLAAPGALAEVEDLGPRAELGEEAEGARALRELGDAVRGVVEVAERPRPGGAGDDAGGLVLVLVSLQ